MGKTEKYGCELCLPIGEKRKSRKALARAAKDFAQSFFKRGVVIVVSLILKVRGKTSEIGLMLYPDLWRGERYRGGYVLLPAAGGALSVEDKDRCLAEFRSNDTERITEFLMRLRKYL